MRISGREIKKKRGRKRYEGRGKREEMRGIRIREERRNNEEKKRKREREKEKRKRKRDLCSHSEGTTPTSLKQCIFTEVPSEAMRVESAHAIYLYMRATLCIML